MKKLLFPRLVVLSFALTCLSVFQAGAGVILWNGSAGDNTFSTGGNWVGGAAPNNNDWQDTARFDTGSPVVVNLTGGRSILGVNFASAGWTLSGSNFVDLTTLQSAGVGTNTLTNSFQLFAHATWTLGTGNVLALNNASQSFYQKDRNLTLNGGGTLSLATQVGGFSGSIGIWGIHIQNATLEMKNHAMVHTSGSAGTVWLDSLNATLILKSSVSAAQALIGGRVRDGLGNGLTVTQIDADYVRITAVPEPGAGAFCLIISGLGLVFVRRRKSVNP